MTGKTVLRDTQEAAGDASVADNEVHNRRQTLAALKRFGRKRHNLIPILQAVQQRLGYLPPEAMIETAAFLGIPEVDVYGVVTFFNQFRLNPPGRHSIRVCLGTACHMKGGYITLDAWRRRLDIDAGETTPDREFDLDTVACVGCCTMAPVVVVDDQTEGKVEPTKVDGLLLAFEREREAGEREEG
jgi:NADH-quinone oxidoreductase subunit E